MSENEKLDELKDFEELSPEELEEQAEQAAGAQSAGPDPLAELQEQLAAALAQAEENLDGWQRAQAEFANYKKRVARDQQVSQEDARGRVIKRYLEILDDLERALHNKPSEGEGGQWAEGVELVYRKLLSYLQAEGVVRMEVDGASFDPNFHEAIAQEESEDHASGEIIEVLQPGYTLGDRVLRPAVVKVAQ